MIEQEAHAALKEKGRQVLGEVMGESYLAKRDATNNDFWGPTRQLSEELAYASLWTREGLDRKQRSMITVAMLCALNRPHLLRWIHLVGMLNNGCTQDRSARDLHPCHRLLRLSRRHRRPAGGRGSAEGTGEVLGMTLDIAQIRAETSGCAHVLHLNAAGSALPVSRRTLDATVDYLRLEAEIGGHEACRLWPTPTWKASIPRSPP